MSAAAGELAGRLIAHADVQTCDKCSVPTSLGIGSYWLASDDLWQRVVGSEVIALCPHCFTARAKAVGVAISWQAVEDLT